MAKRVIISQDYDGCYSIVTPNGLAVELSGPNSECYRTDEELRTVLMSIPQLYEEYLDTITAGAAAVSVYVGSDRQSYYIDKNNSDRNKNESVFTALKTLCEQRTNDFCPWTFERYLLADAGHERGAALSKIESNDPPHLDAPKPTQFTSDQKPSKIPLLMAQMLDAYQQYPDEELEFHFVDDRHDLINDIILNLNPEKIPSGMTLKLSKFDVVGLLQEEEGSLGLVVTISSSQAQEDLNWHHRP